MHYSKESYVNEQLENRSSVESENESETLLPWTPVKKQTPFRWLYWLLLGLSYIFVAGLTYGLVKLEGSQPATEDEHISPWMASIDRSFHHEVGNAAESISPNPNDPDAGNESWNNFTVSAEIGGSEIENWWLDLGSYSKLVTDISLSERTSGTDFNPPPSKTNPRPRRIRLGFQFLPNQTRHRLSLRPRIPTRHSSLPRLPSLHRSHAQTPLS